MLSLLGPQSVSTMRGYAILNASECIVARQFAREAHIGPGLMKEGFADDLLDVSVTS